jgi:adenine/guanine phosphoribosyltransferase-like PRPP-binding protein
VLAAKAGAPGALAALLLDRMPPGLVTSGVQVTWVPGHPLRTVVTPDSGRALAAAVVRRTNDIGVSAELVPLLGRSPLGRRQARRSSEDRRSGAHRLGLRSTSVPHGEVVLIDDVRTTGATLDHAARLLREAGAERVLAITVAAAAAELER